MKKAVTKIHQENGQLKKPLSPTRPQDRRELIKDAVDRTVKEYGEALKRLGSE